MEAITDPVLKISLISLISLLVNAVTIYRWISESRKQTRINDQAFEMIRGLALGNTRRCNMIVQRIRSLEQRGKTDEDAMIFLENMYADAKSNIESLLATAKALRPGQANKLPFDGDALLTQSMIENLELQLKRKQLEEKLGLAAQDAHGAI